MTSSNQFACPSCDAPLTAEPGQTEITCKFCGTTVIVPEALRSQVRQAPPERVAQPSFIPPPAPPVIIVQQPEMVYTLPTAQMQPRRRSSCGCGCGCGTLLLLLVAACIGLSLLAAQSPALLSSAFSSMESRIPQLNTMIASVPAKIIFFQASPLNVSGNTPVVLTWVAFGESITLERTDSRNNTPVQKSPVLPFGSQTFYLAPGAHSVTFRLTASGQGGAEHRDLTVNVR